MRHPNGYGSVVKLSGNRRRPFHARKTKGFDERGYPIYLTIGYYATRKEALIALAEYNQEPYDLDSAKITLKELYDKWIERDSTKMPENTLRSYRTTMRHCAALHDIPYRNIRAYQMQDIMDNCGRGYSTQWAIKNLFGRLDMFALELDIISKKNSAFVHVSAPPPATTRKPFTKEEIDLIWEHKDKSIADTVLILIYSGFRISELLNMKTEDVNLEERWFKGGIKTKAGKDRIVPIHDLIYDFVKKRVEEGNEYLITIDGEVATPFQYYYRWRPFMKFLGMKHIPHECRHTFRTLLDSAGANKRCIDLMMGHASGDIGERVYTHKTLEELRKALALVTR